VKEKIKNMQLANRAIFPQTPQVSSFCPEVRDWSSFLTVGLATNMSSYYQATSPNPVTALNSGQGIDKEKTQNFRQQMITAFFHYLVFHILTTVR